MNPVESIITGGALRAESSQLSLLQRFYAIERVHAIKLATKKKEDTYEYDFKHQGSDYNAASFLDPYPRTPNNG